MRAEYEHYAWSADLTRTLGNVIVYGRSTRLQYLQLEVSLMAP
jgi:hypothetical protein